METIESERLFLRPLTLEDDEFILQLLNTDGFIKYIGDRNVKTIEQAKNYLLNGPLKSYETNGFGLSLVELKTGRTPIGMCGLLKRDYLDHPDIGFAFLPDLYRKRIRLRNCKRNYSLWVAQTSNGKNFSDRSS